VINAPKEKVWKTMLSQDSYRAWTETFMPGSHYVGDWSQESKILFLAPGESGEMSGMVSRIRENRLYEFISIQHLGEVHEGKEDTLSEEGRRWSGALESYTFKAIDGATQVSVETDTVDEFEEMFQNAWPKALQKLKELAEK
jgi:hypothetical protein